MDFEPKSCLFRNYPNLQGQDYVGFGWIDLKWTLHFYYILFGFGTEVF